jgi:cation transport ATPase
MNNETDNLKNLWQKARKDGNSEPSDANKIVAMAKQQIRSSIKLQLSTIIILIIVAVGLSVFFMYVSKFKHTLSHIGEGLMLGGLAVRIIIEWFSIHLSSNIDLSKTALKTSNESLAYAKFRKQINGPVTIAILILYTIGFYMLTPEFSLYFSTPVMILIDLSYIVAAVIFTLSIRNSIKKEKKILNEILRIRNDITGEVNPINIKL